MKNFNEWLLSLKETVTFQVVGISDKEKMGDDYLVIIEQLAKKLRQQMFVKEFDAASENSGLSYYQLMEMSDNYFNTPDTTEIHFWAGFFPEDSRKKILDAILYLLPEFHLRLKDKVKSKQLVNYNSENKYGEKPTLVYEIPVSVISETEKAAPSVNINNDNAIDILNMLNIHTHTNNLCGTISVHDLSLKLSLLTDFHKDMTLRAPKNDKNIVDFGLDESQLKRYIAELERLVQWALQNHYDTISYC